MHRIIRIYTITKDGNPDELHITHGYQNTKGEIYLLDNECCRTIEENNEIPQVICEQISLECSEIDTNEDINMEVMKVKDNKLKKIPLNIQGSFI